MTDDEKKYSRQIIGKTVVSKTGKRYLSEISSEAGTAGLARGEVDLIINPRPPTAIAILSLTSIERSGEMRSSNSTNQASPES